MVSRGAISVVSLARDSGHCCFLASLQSTHLQLRNAPSVNSHPMRQHCPPVADSDWRLRHALPLV